MITHLALFTFHETVDEEQVDQLTGALRAMAGRLAPVLSSYECGPALGITPGADYGVVARVESVEDLRSYLDSAEHREVYDRILGQMLRSRQAAQIATEGV